MDLINIKLERTLSPRGVRYHKFFVHKQLVKLYTVRRVFRQENFPVNWEYESGGIGLLQNFVLHIQIYVIFVSLQYNGAEV